MLAYRGQSISVLYREPKLLKHEDAETIGPIVKTISVLYREPKLLKLVR
jgi:hypothetical protein